MFSIFTYVMSRVTHSEPGLPMVILGNYLTLSSSIRVLYIIVSLYLVHQVSLIALEGVSS